MLQGLKSARSYTGPVKACILDWSGTTIDKYVIAPAVVFVEVFKKNNVPITISEARGPMGMRKDLHIKALTQEADIRQRWHDVHGRYPDQSDVDRMFMDYIPLQLSCIRQYSDLLPGVADTIQKLKSDYNIKIGASTGFLKAVVDVILEEAKKQGYEPDSSVAGDEVFHGSRPRPFMIFRNLDLLDVHPVQSVVKVDDTVSGIGEAIEGGCWGVGVARYSNYMNIDSFEHEQQLSEEDINSRLQKSREILVNSGAHYVIDSLIGLPNVITEINEKLSRGEKP